MFKKSKIRPGKATTVRVKADSGSLCGIGVVDKSVHLVGADNQMSPEKVLTDFETLEVFSVCFLLIVFIHSFYSILCEDAGSITQSYYFCQPFV